MLRRNRDHPPDDNELPIAPHLAGSKRRHSSDERRPRKLHIQYNRPNASGSSDRVSKPINQSMTNIFLIILQSSPSLDDFIIQDEAQQNEALVIERPHRVGPRSRSFFTIPDIYKDVTLRAASLVKHYTWFENPMLTASEIAQLVTETWDAAQEEKGTSLE
jgi:hypothetical protein